MTSTMLAGLSLIDATGLTILTTTVLTLLVGIAAYLWLRGRYAALEKEVRQGQSEVGFSEPVLRHIVSNTAEPKVSNRGRVHPSGQQSEAS